MFVSIGITAHNEEKNIGNLLEKLSKEKYSFKLREIIVVASGCTDRTVDIIKDFMKKNKKIKLIKEKKRKGKTSAVNIILKKSKGEVIVFVCADNIPKKNSINKLVKEISNEKIGAVSGRPIPLEIKDTFFGYISYLIWNLHNDVCLINPKISGELFSIKKGIVKKIPYSIINDDGYITAILRKKGYKIIYANRAVTYMTGNNSLFSHINRRRRIARGFVQLKRLGFNVNIPPFLILKYLVRRIKKEPSKVLKIFFAVLLEFIANLLAFYDTVRGKTPYCWKR